MKDKFNIVTQALTRLKSLEAALLLAMLPTALILLLTRSGSYLNNYLFFEPAMKLRMALDLSPSLDPSVRVILFEDKSLDKLDRQPKASEWLHVASTLFREGFKTVFLLGLHDDEATELQLTAEGRLIVGAVAAVEADNTRTLKASDLPTKILTAADGSKGSYAPLTRVIAPSAATLRAASAVGHQNILSNYEMPAAYEVSVENGDFGHVLANIGLLADPDIRWRDGKLIDRGGEIATSPDGTLYIDFINPAEISAQALPATVFFDRDYKPYPELGAKAQAKLAGGKVAVLVPDAFTGSRFLDAPMGKVLGYVAVVSMINSALQHHFLHRPFSTWLFVVCGLPLIFLLLRDRRPTVALGGTAALGALLALASLVLVLGADRVLPCAEMLLLIGTGFGVRTVNHMIVSLSEKLALTKEMEMGRTVQRLLLPKTFAGQLGAWEYKIVYRPYWAMAGDWFQIFQTPPEAKEQAAVVVTGDGLGKGPSAALNTAVIAAVWNSCKDRWSTGEIEVDTFITALDRTIRLTFAGEQNSTLQIAVLREHDIMVGSCASPHWVHFKAGARTAKPVLNPPANPLGLVLLENEAPKLPQLKTLTPDEGDVFIAYSDGVIDGMAAAARFRKQLVKVDQERPDLFEEIERLATEAGKDEALPDDFTLLLIRRSNAAANAGATPPKAVA